MFVQKFYRSIGIAGLILALGVGSSHAAILPIGDVNPAYNNIDDPWNVPAGILLIGQASNGSLEVTGGSDVVSTFGTLGGGSGVTGGVTVTGTGSTWTNQLTLFVGSSGTGQLNIQDAGVVSSLAVALGTAASGSGSGTIDVTGADSALNVGRGLVVGGSYNLATGVASPRGTGVVNIANGGRITVGDEAAASTNGHLVVSDADLGVASVTVFAGDQINNTAGDTVIGDEKGEFGVMTVSGNGALFDTGNEVAVGRSGTGTLTVEDGGVVTANNSLVSAGLDQGSNGMVTVTGTDSRLDITGGALEVGVEGTGLMNVAQGGSVLASDIHISTLTGSMGTVTVSGSGSSLFASNELVVGSEGVGVLNIQNLAQVENRKDATIGSNSGSEGTVTVTGNNTQWSTDSLSVAFSGTGTLNIVNGGSVDVTDDTDVGSDSGAIGEVNVIGANSQWFNGGDLDVGIDGQGTLNIEDGGVVTNARGLLGISSGSEGTATVTGADSRWSSSDSLFVGGGTLSPGGEGTLNIQSGGRVTVGDASAASTAGALVISDADASGTDGGVLNIYAGSTVNVAGRSVIGDDFNEYGWATVTGDGAELNSSSSLVVGQGGTGTLTIKDGGAVTNTTGFIGSGGDFTSTVTVTGDDSLWHNTSVLFIGEDGGSGTLNILNGGTVISSRAVLGEVWGGANVRVAGDESVWHSGSLEIGKGGSASMIIEGGGKVMSTSSAIGLEHEDVNNSVTVRGKGSQWINSGLLRVGLSEENAFLSISGGGVVTNSTAILGVFGGSIGTATVTDKDSQWNSSGNLTVGVQGRANLHILNQGLVSVLGVTTIGNLGTVNLNGGRFEFGTMTSADFAEITGVNGALAGQVTDILLTGFNHIDDIGDLPEFSNIAPAVDVSEVVIGSFSNSGVLFGDGSSTASIINNADGTIEVLAANSIVFHMRFDGDGTNNGQYNLFGGQLSFGGDVINNNGIDIIDDGQLIVDGAFTNEATGTITGHGVSNVAGGLTNRGVMNFSSATTDIFGSVTNDTGGTILTTDGGTTTFHDDTVHNGAEIKTTEGSFTVFRGNYSGAGGFTGEGLVRFEGRVNIGNSPESVSFGGDVAFQDTATTTFEIAGLLTGEFDQFLIAGDLDIDGTLAVTLLDGFELGLNQRFLIADVGGDLTGRFIGLGEDALVGSFGGVDLFITYTAGDGNDVALYSIPEPTSLALLGLGGLTLAARRRVIRTF